MSVSIDESWKHQLIKQFQSSYMVKLSNFLKNEKLLGKKIYPKGSLIFNALNLTPFDQVKVVIIGQDPYHGEGQANGLSFSVNQNTFIPPSLKNIFKELSFDLNLPIPTSGDLKPWALQGVLLLNSCLTVEKGKPGSHQNLGWEKFTDVIIKRLSDQRCNLVFILWGKLSRSKNDLIDIDKHHIIESAHPSPFSANNGFFGSKPFSKTNAYLKSKKIKEIDWSL